MDRSCLHDIKDRNDKMSGLPYSIFLMLLRVLLTLSEFIFSHLDTALQICLIISHSVVFIWLKECFSILYTSGQIFEIHIPKLEIKTSGVKELSKFIGEIFAKVTWLPMDTDINFFF